MAELEVGNVAPLFTLKNQDGEKVALKDYAGKYVVVYFYPKADTPGCTTEACEFTESIRDFEKLDAIVLGVSPDEPSALKKFQEKYKLKVTLLSDPDHKVMEKYEAWGEKNMYGKISVGVIRSTVIVGPDGKIAHRWKRAKAKGHAAKVAEVVAELKQKA